MELLTRIRSKINTKKLVYPSILILFFIIVGALFVWTIIFLSTTINNSITPDPNKAKTELIKIDMPTYEMAVKKLNLASGENTGNDNSAQRDVLRINKLEAIKNALASYAADNSGMYPKNLAELVPLYLEKIPTDPSNYTNFSYSYYPAQNPVKYHLGASLETKNAVLDSDADLDTSSSPGGFDGNDNKKCKAEDFGNYCYDLINS
jgi:hypothetical protein